MEEQHSQEAASEYSACEYSGIRERVASL